MAPPKAVQGAAFVEQVRAGTLLYKVDTLAAFAEAVDTGINGEMSQDGIRYGPWQLLDSEPPLAKITGGLPYDLDAQAWAWSSTGIGYAITAMANAGARGLTGHAAVTHIVKYFEQPTDLADATALRITTYDDLVSRGSAVWAYLANLAGGPSLAPIPLTDAAAQAQAEGNPLANAGWRDLLFAFSRTIPRQAAAIDAVARRIPHAVK